MPRLVHDGVGLAYDDAGSGSPALLFVHGWACNRTYFAPQVAYFSRTYRTLAVDLRGHGESDAPQQDYTMEGFADDLAWFCEQLQVEHPVVIGHSMGGMIALMLAAHHPTLPRAIVMLDMPTALIAGPLPPTNPRWQTIEDLRGPHYRDVVRQYAEAMFLPTDDPARREQIVAQMAATPHHVLASAFATGWTCDLAAAAAACAVPALYVESATLRPELERFSQICPQLSRGRTVGSGHFHQLEVPDQINAMIERFLALLTLHPTASAP